MERPWHVSVSKSLAFLGDRLPSPSLPLTGAAHSVPQARETVCPSMADWVVGAQRATATAIAHPGHAWPGTDCRSNQRQP